MWREIHLERRRVFMQRTRASSNSILPIWLSETIYLILYKVPKSVIDLVKISGLV